MSESTSRPMKYPYTLTAKIVQYPWVWSAKNTFAFKWWLIGIVGSIPVFYEIDKLANSKTNKAKWEEIRRKEREGHH